MQSVGQRRCRSSPLLDGLLIAWPDAGLHGTICLIRGCDIFFGSMLVGQRHLVAQYKSDAQASE